MVTFPTATFQWLFAGSSFTITRQIDFRLNEPAWGGYILGRHYGKTEYQRESIDRQNHPRY